MASTLTEGGLSPMAPHQRIVALDVVRGFALFGIFLMNIEWFNRPITELGAGMPVGVEGLDHAVGWFVHTFVRSKFWTMFSLLFGMGFAVMLGRAQAAGRGFLGPYLRRTAALALFGLAHGVLLWTGDILLSYASAAAVLLLALFGRAWLGLLLIAVLAAAAGLLEAPVGGFIAVVALALLVALYLRNDRMVRISEIDVSLSSVVLAGLALAMVVAGVAGMVLQGGKFALLLVGAMVALLAAWLVHRFREPRGRRLLRAGLFLYFAPVLAMLLGAAASMMAPGGQGPGEQSPEQKQQLSAYNQQLAGLFAEFSEKVLADESTYITATEAELAGVPEDVKDAADNSAAAELASIVEEAGIQLEMN